jgi:hypothetical protein
MTNHIAKYEDFLFESEIDVKISETRSGVSKTKEEISKAQELTDSIAKKDPRYVDVEIDSLKKQSVAYKKLSDQLGLLATQLTQKKTAPQT